MEARLANAAEIIMKLNLNTGASKKLEKYNYEIQINFSMDSFFQLFI